MYIDRKAIEKDCWWNGHPHKQYYTAGVWFIWFNEPEDAKELHVTLTGQRIECRVYGATVEVGGNFSCSL